MNKKNIFYIFILFLLGIVSSGLFYLFFNYDPFINLINKRVYKKITIYDKSAQIVDSYICLKNLPLTPVSLTKMPPHLIDAFISSEDSGFFSHKGISPTGIMRSFFTNIIKKRFAQGGSTITQQTIKLLCEDLSKTLKRKIKEQFFSYLTELHHSKEEILEYYFSLLYFGKGITGITNAAKIFWNCDLLDLSIAQSALLAGIIKYPEKYNPYNDYPRAIANKNTVLKRMYNDKKITREEYEKAKTEPIILHSYTPATFYDHIYCSINSFIKNNVLKNESELTFYTTYDASIQKKLTFLCDGYIGALKKNIPDIQCAAIVLNHKTGEIVATFNGEGLYKNNLKRTVIKKQIGSTIKSLVAYYSFLKGDFPYTVYNDEPITEIPRWNPQNYDKKFRGPMNVAESIIFSNNTIPIRILLKHGLYEFFNLCKELSLFDHLSPVYSLALGTMESSVELMAFFIGLFKNKGYGVIPFDITHVFNNSAVLYRHEKDERNYLHEKECSLVHDVLLLSAQQIAQKLNIKIAPDIIAKTGTTNNMKVCWCIAADNHYSIALWFSTDINRSLSKTNIKTLTTAAQCAMEFFNTAYL